MRLLGNKDGVGNRNDVDIQYHGESEITIRLKGDQPQPKTGLKRKASRRKRQPQQDDGESPRKYLAGEQLSLIKLDVNPAGSSGGSYSLCNFV